MSVLASDMPRRVGMNESSDGTKPSWIFAPRMKPQIPMGLSLDQTGSHQLVDGNFKGPLLMRCESSGEGGRIRKTVPRSFGSQTHIETSTDGAVADALWEITALAGT